MTEYRISFAYIIAAGGTRRNSLVWLIFWGKWGTKLIPTAYGSTFARKQIIMMQNQHTW